jgi:hypothetical protein
LFGSSASQAELVAQTWSCPQAGQSMRALILGNLRNTLGSTSIAVDTGAPVMGHLIIMELIAGALRWICVPTRYSMELLGTLAIMELLYQIALPATHLRRCGGLVTAVQAFDLTHVFDVIIPTQSQAT